MEIDPWVVDVAISVVSAAVFGLFGFVWRVSHKVADLEKRLEALRELHVSDTRQITKDIDYIMSKVDKHGDKMYSIVKNL